MGDHSTKDSNSKLSPEFMSSSGHKNNTIPTSLSDHNNSSSSSFGLIQSAAAARAAWLLFGGANSGNVGVQLSQNMNSSTSNGMPSFNGTMPGRLQPSFPTSFDPNGTFSSLFNGPCPPGMTQPNPTATAYWRM